ncbi:hypothetical protein IEO70_13235 [Bacillus sp. AGMB 02131]|uniref:Uncharacterized protein n=1 Tax=Peribacillus faecalis TaxID=2772559 RepID=A0A927CY74_9BACI|nr:hypothetical protein [Peribacillus faecalis]MBD3109309.1 hypothetical protein [Peribacillus faecalis]
MDYFLLPLVNIIIFSVLLIGFIVSVKKHKLNFAVFISRMFFVAGCFLFADATYEGKITATILEEVAIYFEFGLITMICGSILVAFHQRKQDTA